MVLPNFLVIGAQKTGTKWLYYNLNSHPDIFVANGAGLECNYFNTNNNIIGNLNRYSRLFNDIKNKKIKGDISPGYSIIDKKKIALIRQLIPDVKIIITLRNPKERAISAARMEIKGLTYAGKQRKILLTEESSKEDIINYCCSSEGFKYGNYPAQLENWLSIIPSNQIIILSYELLVNNPQEYLAKIFNFLDVNIYYDYNLIRKRIHVTEKYILPLEVYKKLDEAYHNVIKDLSTMVNFDIKHWLKPIKR